jgi:ATP-dependent DNA helicase Rep
VLAGAGSGKTRVITHKLAYLIRDCGIAARHIAAVTFTNKAAREMKQRVGGLLHGKESSGLIVSTFHTLGLNILKREHARLGYRPGFSIFDAQDSTALLRELWQQAANDSSVEQVQVRISHWKNGLLSPEAALAQAQDEGELAAARVFALYQQHLRAYNAVDFDDLIRYPVQLLQEHRAVLETWEHRIRYLLVDEYQDTNASQYQLVKLLMGRRGALTVVGDDDQSVYAWRGARPENLRLLAEDFPKLKVIKLEQNYRSTRRILRAANHLIARNPHVFEKRLWSELGEGDPIRVLHCRDEEHEAERVVSELLHYQLRHRASLRDYAILYRGNYQARVFERVLREHRIPYFLSGGTSFFERVEIKDIMAYLRLLVNHDDDNAFLRIINTPRREI